MTLTLLTQIGVGVFLAGVIGLSIGLVVLIVEWARSRVEIEHGGATEEFADELAGLATGEDLPLTGEAPRHSTHKHTHPRDRASAFVDTAPLPREELLAVLDDIGVPADQLRREAQR